jgi:hypothetical protein
LQKSFVRPAVRSRNLAPAAPSPACAAAATPAAAASAATPTPAAAPAPAAPLNLLHAAANIFLIEQVERGETDVGQLHFVKNEAVLGPHSVRRRNFSSGRRRCGCTSHQRKSQSGGPERRHCGFGRAVLFRSLLRPWHGHILQESLRKRSLNVTTMRSASS